MHIYIYIQQISLNMHSHSARLRRAGQAADVEKVSKSGLLLGSHVPVDLLHMLQRANVSLSELGNLEIS